MPKHMGFTHRSEFVDMIHLPRAWKKAGRAAKFAIVSFIGLIVSAVGVVIFVWISLSPTKNQMFEFLALIVAALVIVAIVSKGHKEEAGGETQKKQTKITFITTVVIILFVGVVIAATVFVWPPANRVYQQQFGPRTSVITLCKVGANVSQKGTTTSIIRDGNGAKFKLAQEVIMNKDALKKKGTKPVTNPATVLINTPHYGSLSPGYRYRIWYQGLRVFDRWLPTVTALRSEPINQAVRGNCPSG